jgi:Holliday junction resolvase RusA-like endonuclease
VFEMGGPDKMVEIVIARPPSVNRLWRMGKGRMYRSVEYISWLSKCMVIAKEQNIPTVLGKYKIMVRILRPDKRRRDLDNISTKAIQDFLQHAGIIQDDCLCEALYCKWVETGPEVRINIYPVRGDHELPRRTKDPVQRSPQADGAVRNTGASPREKLAAAYAEARTRTARKKARIGFGKS